MNHMNDSEVRDTVLLQKASWNGAPLQHPMLEPNR